MCLCSKPGLPHIETKKFSRTCCCPTSHQNKEISHQNKEIVGTTGHLLHTRRTLGQLWPSPVRFVMPAAAWWSQPSAPHALQLPRHHR